MATAMSNEGQFVVFRLEQEEYGLDIVQVKEIIKSQTITKLPDASEYIEGVTNIRGEVIPVVSLRKRFGLPSQDDTSHTRIIIVEIADSLVGFIVDEVNEVLSIPSSAIDPPPANIVGVSDYLQGVGKVDQRLLIILHANRLLGSPEELQEILDSASDYVE